MALKGGRARTEQIEIKTKLSETGRLRRNCAFATDRDLIVSLWLNIIINPSCEELLPFDT